MTISARAPSTDLYQALRHLFYAAQKNSDAWAFHGSFTEPGQQVMTEYQNKYTGARIKAFSDKHDGSKYTEHTFTFKQEVDE